MVFFDDGKLRAEVIDVEEDAIKVRFKEGGHLANNVQIRLQGSRYEMIPLLQNTDSTILKDIFSKFPFEYVSVPCIQNGKDLQEFKLAMGTEMAGKI